MRLGLLAASAALALSVSPAFAVQCEPAGGFPDFLAEFHRYAEGQGVGRRGLAALDGLTLDRNVLSRDHRQGVFRQSFEQFSGRMISRDRMVKGERYLKTMAPTFRRIEQRYGVPGGVLVAIWAIDKARASGTARSAAAGIVALSAVSGRWTSASPPRSAIRRRPRAPSALAPVSTMPTARFPYASAIDVKVTSIDGRLNATASSVEREKCPSSTSRW